MAPRVQGEDRGPDRRPAKADLVDHPPSLVEMTQERRGSSSRWCLHSVRVEETVTSQSRGHDQSVTVALTGLFLP